MKSICSVLALGLAPSGIHAPVGAPYHGVLEGNGERAGGPAWGSGDVNLDVSGPG